MFNRALLSGWNKVNKQHRLKYYVFTSVTSGRDYGMKDSEI